MPSKYATRSPLDRLPLHVKQQLAAWLTTGGPHGQGITYAEARARLRERHGVCASIDALALFFRRIHRRPEILREHARVRPALTMTITISAEQPRKPIALVEPDRDMIARLREDPGWKVKMI